MILSAGRVVRALLLGGVLIVGTSGAVTAADPSPTPVPAGASPSGDPSGVPTLTATPSVITTSVQPGGRGIATLTLKAGVGLDIRISPQGLGQSIDDGSFSFLPAKDDKSPYTARPFLDVQPARFRIEAGDTRQVDVTIAMPSLPADGERFAILQVNGTPLPGEGNVGIAVALGVSVLVDLPGTLTSISGELDELKVADTLASDPLMVTGAVRNTGNVHYGASPKQLYQAATLRDANGRAIAESKQTLLGNSILPTHARRFALTVQPPQAVPAGKYTIDVVVGLTDGTVLDQQTLDLDTSGIAGPPPVVPATPVPESSVPWPAIGLGVAAGLLLLGAVLFLVWRRRRRQPAA